jgi:N-acyl homoserine lactone hydrolase
MQIHALQTGTVVIKERQLAGHGQGLGRQMNMLFDTHWTDALPIYAWVIEHPEGVIVVDTGETARAMQPGYFSRWHPYYRTSMKLDVRPEDEIGPQLKDIGIEPADVRRVILTHLHTDHAGGLHHFPKSEILVSPVEYAATGGFGGWMSGYLRQRWPTWFAPRFIEFTSIPVGTFTESFTLTRAGDVHIVPTPGHSAGHVSVILSENGQSILFAGDSSYTEQFLLDQVVDGVSTDQAAARQTLKRILAYTQQTPTVYLPSHDPASAERLRRRQVVPL